MCEREREKKNTERATRGERKREGEREIIKDGESLILHYNKPPFAMYRNVYTHIILF